MQRRCLRQPLQSCPETCMFARNGTGDKITEKLHLTDIVAQDLQDKLQNTQTTEQAIEKITYLQKRARFFVSKNLQVPLGFTDCIIDEFCERGYTKE